MSHFFHSIAFPNTNSVPSPSAKSDSGFIPFSASAFTFILQPNYISSHLSKISLSGRFTDTLRLALLATLRCFNMPLGLQSADPHRTPSAIENMAASKAATRTNRAGPVADRPRVADSTESADHHGGIRIEGDRGEGKR